jgi:hypothetical protein
VGHLFVSRFSREKASSLNFMISAEELVVIERAVKAGSAPNKI